ncbi:MAG: hypothetical protein IPL36_00535 [Nigerium sp.]|nr:hypothetical protein [Nigerium sp.]
MRVGPLVVAGAAGFALASSLVAVLPAFRFESQFPALLPLIAWAAAAGIGPLMLGARRLLDPWRAAHGLIFVAPYVVLLMLSVVLPERSVPWWVAVAVAATATVPFATLALRRPELFAYEPARPADVGSRRGTFLISLALMLLAYAVAGPPVIGPLVGGLTAAGLVVGALLPAGLARAAHTWPAGHWAALLWGSTVVWASSVLHGLTSFFVDPWFVATAMVFAGVPLVVVNSMESNRAASVGRVAP